MKQIAIINGSPRQNGNTRLLLKTFTDAIGKMEAGISLDFIDAAQSALKPCIACDVCKKNGGECVVPDGSAALMDRVIAADGLVFASPVYWWGLTAQIKTFIDKMYSKSAQLSNGGAKKIGVIITGEAELADRQYELIKGQFECICEYLGWDFSFYQSVSAARAGDVGSQTATLAKTAAHAQAFAAAL